MRADFERFAITMTLGQAKAASHAGSCDEDVAILSKQSGIVKQLKAIDPDDLRAELKGYGAWDEEDLADHDANVLRILWIAAGEITDSQR